MFEGVQERISLNRLPLQRDILLELDDRSVLYSLVNS